MKQVIYICVGTYPCKWSKKAFLYKPENEYLIIP